MKIKLDHINLTVRDLAESIDWYSKIFGFKLVERGIGLRGQPWAIVANNDSMVVMGEYKDKKSASDGPDEEFHQINHFGIRVPELEAWENVVQEFRLKLYYGGVIDYPYSKSWYIHDPSGHEIEVSYAGGAELQFPKS